MYSKSDFRLSKRVDTNKLETGTAGLEHEDNNHDSEEFLNHVLSMWFMIEDKTKISNVWPGAIALCRHIERSFAAFRALAPSSMWLLIDLDRPQTDRDCWHLFLKILDILRNNSKENPSIAEGILQSVEIDNKMREQMDMPPATTDIDGILVFSVLCWSTFAFTPTLRPPDNEWSFAQDRPSIKRNFLERPVSALFKEIRKGFPSSRWQRPIGAPLLDEKRSLQTASLTYKNLNKIGNVTIHWVDDICDHLNLDSTHRKLSLFRFPTFCALSTLGPSKGPVFETMSNALYNKEYFNGNITVQLHQELLMSYRLLCGGSKGSANRLFTALQEIRGEPDFDPLLEVLCTKKRKFIKLHPTCWPESCRDDQGAVLEDSVYNVDDFPMFGQRLLKLQEFSDRQSPSSWRELWSDTRDLPRWWTVWAVALFGGASIILSVLQLLVSIFQVWLAWKQQP